MIAPRLVARASFNEGLPLPSAVHFLPARQNQGRLLAIFFLILAPCLCGALSLYLGQDANWDLRNYHFYNAYAFLNDRYGIDLLPSQTPYFYNPTLDVPFFVLASHVPARVAGFLLSAVQGLNVDLIFMIAYATLRIANPRRKVIVCAALASLGFLGGEGIALLGTTFYDNVTSIGIFVSLLLILRYYRVLVLAPWRQAIVTAFVFGLPSGLMMGLKLPSVIFCVGLCGALVTTGGSWSRRFFIANAFGCGILVGVAMSLGHWAWFLERTFGSPLFPYFNEFFKSPLAPLTSARDTQYVVRSVNDALFFPFIFSAHPLRVGEIPWRDWRIPILYALLPLALIARLLFGRARVTVNAIAEVHASRYLLWLCVLSYAVWLPMFCIYRYLIPLEMLAPLAIVCVMGLLPLRAQPRSLLTFCLLVVIACAIEPGNWSRRDHWADKFVAATIPPLGDPSNLMIIMAAFEPYSHLVTQFPPAIPFIRIQSNFSSPDEGKAINTLIAERLDAHRGRFMILIPPWQHDIARDALQFFKLQANWQACQNVVDRLYDDHQLDLCPVTRF